MPSRYAAILMNKREQLFRRVEEIKERIRNVPTEELVDRYNSGYLSKEGTFATREILDERGEAHLIGSRL
jgi:hypothetical protein